MQCSEKGLREKCGAKKDVPRHQYSGGARVCSDVLIELLYDIVAFAFFKTLTLRFLIAYETSQIMHFK